MLDQIRAACPKKLATNPNDPPQLGASHYQLAAVHEPGESNRKGAGRPSWFPAHPQPFWKIDEAPDAMPGRYMVKFWGYEGTSWYQVGELQVLDLSIGRALPVPAPPAQAQPAAPPQQRVAQLPPPVISFPPNGALFSVRQWRKSRGIIRALGCGACIAHGVCITFWRGAPN